MKTKNGVSLIVLVITIIVIIILAAAVIINLSNNNPITQAGEARVKSDFQSYDELFSLWLGKEYVSSLGSLDPLTVNVDKNGGTYVKDGVTTAVTLETILPGITNTPNKDKIKIVDGKTNFIGTDPAEQAAMKTSGIKLAYTNIKGSNTYDIPYIPAGFYYVGGSWNKGLVISDNSADFNKGADATLSGNQFVWVPVKDGVNSTDGAYIDSTTIQYKRWCTSGSSYTFKVDDTLPTDVTSETSQITNYGGFYVGRYIASLDYNGGATRAMSKKGTNATTEAYWAIPSGAAGTGYLWNNINWTDSKTKAQAMYVSTNSTSVRSGLLTGKMWDTTMRWIELSGKSVTDSRSWGNYSDSIAPANVALPSTLKKAGYSEFWKVNNIYDMAGNVRQYTSELNYYSPTTNAVARTSNWANSGSAQPASYRDIVMTTGFGEWYTGFRVALYIL